MKISFRLILATAVLICMAGAANAASIQYSLGDLGGNNYQYDYTIDWNGLSGPINLVIFFPDVFTADSSYYTLDSAIAPSGWVINLFQASTPDLGAMVDYGTLSSSLANWGFNILFAYTGGRSLGSQYFEVYVPNFGQTDPSLDLVDFGYTSAVPEPSTLILLATVLPAVMALRKKLHR